MSQYFPYLAPMRMGPELAPCRGRYASTGMPGFIGPSPSTSLDKATVIHLLMLAGTSARASSLRLRNEYANIGPQPRQTLLCRFACFGKPRRKPYTIRLAHSR